MNARHARLMADYNRWMNVRLYAVCAELDDAERRKDRRAFFSSIHGTLNHLLLGDRIWLGRFLDEPFVVESLDEELYADFEELSRQRAITDDVIDRWVGELTDEQLNADFAYTSIVNPAPRRCPLWILVTHLFNHQTHHRGQVTQMLSALGVDYGTTDLVWLPGVVKDA